MKVRMPIPLYGLSGKATPWAPHVGGGRRTSCICWHEHFISRAILRVARVEPNDFIYTASIDPGLTVAQAVFSGIGSLRRIFKRQSVDVFKKSRL